MAKNSLPIVVEGAFYIDQASLTAIKSSIEGYTGRECSVKVVFDDEFAFTSTSLQEVFEHTHFRSNSAKSVIFTSFSTYDDPSKNSVTFSASSQNGYGRVSVNIESDTDNIYNLNNALQKEIVLSQTKFNRLYTIDGLYWLASFSIICSASLFYYVNLSESSKLYADIEKANRIVNPIILGVALGPVVVYFLNKLKTYLFPYFTVGIGRAETFFTSKHDFRRWAFRLVGGTIALYLITDYLW